MEWLQKLDRLTCPRSPYAYAMFLVAYDCGLRARDAKRLKSEHCDFERRVLVVPTSKTGNMAISPMSDRLADMLRRLVERNVRFVQIFHSGQPWDNHRSIRTSLPAICRKTDKPSAALVKDLKQRGLLDTTIVHWGGEIGRLPVTQSHGAPKLAGRDHNGQGFSIWMAGGGIKPGMTYGETDEFGHKAVKNIVTPNDYQATLLHLFGLNHKQLAYHHNGQQTVITNNRKARVVKEILA